MIIQKIPRPVHLLLATAYLPPVEYFAWILLADKVSIEAHETYPKQTWRNRCKIAAANGPLNLSIPVEKPLGNHTPTGMVKVSRHAPWQRQHWKSIELAYNKSAFFMHYCDLFEPFFAEKPPVHLVELNFLLLKAILGELQVNVNPCMTDDFMVIPDGMVDLRNAISPKNRGDKRPDMKIFQPYFQGFSDKYGFVPNLSIIDLLFNLGPETMGYLRNCSQKIRKSNSF